MISQLFILVGALYCIIHGATLATKYAVKIAANFRLSPYAVGFIVVAIISILPETFISIASSLEGIPAFGFGVLLGSNVADLTLVIAIIILTARRPLTVESKILVHHAIYPFLLLFPIVFGFDGHLSRIEGIALIIAGMLFYYLTLKQANTPSSAQKELSGRRKNILFLLLSVALLLVGAHFTVSSASTIATLLGMSPVLIGMLIVGLGTTMPELFFSLKAVKQHHDSLAVGDVLGTVLADATIVVGILALINPFNFPKTIIYVAGVFMVAGAFILFSFMRSGKSITEKEAFALIVFWLTFIAVESIISM